MVILVIGAFCFQILGVKGLIHYFYTFQIYFDSFKVRLNMSSKINLAIIDVNIFCFAGKFSVFIVAKVSSKSGTITLLWVYLVIYSSVQLAAFVHVYNILAKLFEFLVA